MDNENTKRILYALIEDCGDLISKLQTKSILSEALLKLQKLE